jgi:hypothetical protein
MTAAAQRERWRKKQNGYRRRRRQGSIVLKIEAAEYPLIEALITSGRLTPDQALDRAEIEREIAAVVEDWRCAATLQWARGSARAR